MRVLIDAASPFLLTVLGLLLLVAAAGIGLGLWAGLATAGVSCLVLDWFAATVRKP